MSTDEDKHPEDGTPSESVSPQSVSPAQARASERAARKVAKASEKAARAQRRADEARQRALDAVQAGGFLPASAAAAPAKVEEPAKAAGPAKAGEPATVKEATKAEATEGEPTPNQAEKVSDASAPLDSGEARGAGPAKAPRKVLVALSLATVVFLALAVLAGIKWQGAREDVSAEQQISTAPDLAAEAAKSIVTDMFTYDWQSVGPKLDAVQPRLTGAAEEEFRTRSRAAAESAAKQAKASVFATVAAVAPTKIESADSVTLLMMLNQMISTEKDPKAQSSASRLTVTMNRVEGGEWKLAKLEAI